MTKKDYQVIADIFRRQREEIEESVSSSSQTQILKLVLLRDIAKQLANFFQKENPRFDREKFEEAIYGERLPDEDSELGEPEIPCGDCGRPSTHSIGENYNRCDRCVIEE